MRNIIFLITLLSVSYLFNGCAMSPPLTTAQKRSIQTRTYERTSYENVFRAFKTVLQDEGYVIKNQDIQGGLITGITQKSKSASAKVFSLEINTSDDSEVRGEGKEISINLEKMSDSISEARVVIQNTTVYEKGGDTGEEILEPTVYRSFFNKVQVEIERRKAQGKDSFAAPVKTNVRVKRK